MLAFQVNVSFYTGTTLCILNGANFKWICKAGPLCKVTLLRLTAKLHKRPHDGSGTSSRVRLTF